jgi:hypothetical protein
MSNPAFVETKGVLADVYTPAKFSAAKKKALQGLMFKSFSGFFELNKRSLESFVEWPDLKAYGEVDGRGGRLFRISLVGIDASNDTTALATLAGIKREKTRTLVKSLYADSFVNASSKDKKSIDDSVNSFQTFALLVSRGVVKKKAATRSKKLPSEDNNQVSIFDLVEKNPKKGGSSLECVGAITVSVCNSFQFVHWIDVSGKQSEGSVYRSWRNRGVGAYLIHVLVKRAMLPSVNVPPAIMLQCQGQRTLTSTLSPLRFYLRLGFSTHVHDDNGLARLSDNAKFAALEKKYPFVFVRSNETVDMCLMELAIGKLVNYAQPVIEMLDDDDDGKDGAGNIGPATHESTLYAKFPVVAGLHELESLVEGMQLLSLFGVPLYDTNNNIDEKQCMYVLRDHGNKALLSGSVTRNWRSSYDTHAGASISLWLTSGSISLMLAWTLRNCVAHQETVLVVPPDVTVMIESAWEAFVAVTTAPNDDPMEVAKLTEKWHRSEVCLNSYLLREADQFQRKLIYYVNNHGNSHWSVTVAINPIFVGNTGNDELRGFLHMDSMSGNGSCTGEPITPTAFKFFLNYAHSILVVPDIESVMPFQEPFGPSANFSGTVDFPQIVFNAPSIVVQGNADDVNCGLAVVTNIALSIKKWTNSQLTQSARGVTVVGNIVKLDHYYAPSSECSLYQPSAICQMVRREFEVFVDRLAVLTHSRTTATADEFDRYLSDYGPFFELDIQHMRPDIFVGIPGAPKAPPSSSWQSECAAGGQNVPRSMGCQQNNIPLLGIYTLCIGCNSRMHKGCGLSLGKINKRWPVVCGQCISKDAAGLS